MICGEIRSCVFPRGSIKGEEREHGMNTLQKISDTTNKAVSFLGMLIFIVLIITCVMQVFFRFILDDALSWSEELARYAFVWMHMLGTSLLIESGSHATVTAVLDLLHGAVRKVVDIIIQLVILANGVIMVWAGAVLSYSSRNNLSTALSLPMWCINISVAVGGVLVIFQCFVQICVLLKGKSSQEVAAV